MFCYTSERIQNGLLALLSWIFGPTVTSVLIGDP